MKSDNLRKNGSGYYDPTAYQAIMNADRDDENIDRDDENIDRDDENFHKLLFTIFNLCELSGFRIEGRIVLVDKETGKVWR